MLEKDSGLGTVWVRKVKVGNLKLTFNMSLNLREGTGRLDKVSVQFCPELEQLKENMRSFVAISVKHMNDLWFRRD